MMTRRWCRAQWPTPSPLPDAMSMMWRWRWWGRGPVWLTTVHGLARFRCWRCPRRPPQHSNRPYPDEQSSTALGWSADLNLYWNLGLWLALLMDWNPHHTQPHPKLIYLETQPHPTQLVNFSTLTNPPHYKRVTHKNLWVLLCRGI